MRSSVTPARWRDRKVDRKAHRRAVRLGRFPGVALLALTLIWAPTTYAAGANARAATGRERAAIVSAFTAADGNAAEVRGVYVSRSNSSLAVVCAHAPEAGMWSYLFGHSRGAWRYLTSGQAGKAGGPGERTLERACQ